jgi:hypothetical protein
MPRASTSNELTPRETRWPARSPTQNCRDSPRSQSHLTSRGVCNPCAEGVRGKRTPPEAACRCPTSRMHHLQSCGGCDSNRTPSECLNNTKANSASSKLGVHCVQPRAAHGSHTAFAAAHSGFTCRQPSCHVFRRRHRASQASVHADFNCDL